MLVPLFPELPSCCPCVCFSCLCVLTAQAHPGCALSLTQETGGLVFSCLHEQVWGSEYEALYLSSSEKLPLRGLEVALL